MAPQVLRALSLSRDQVNKMTGGDAQATRQIEALLAIAQAALQMGGFVPRGTLDEVIASVALVGSPVGCRTTITDSNATTTAGIGTVVTGGGVEVVPAYFDGADWRIG